MKFKSDQYCLSTILSNAPKFADVLAKLDASPHACYVGTGRMLSKVLARKLYSAPMLVVRSKRMTESWRPYLYDERPRFSIDQLAPRGQLDVYWTWDGPGLSLSFKTLDYAGLLCDAIEARKPMLVAWVVGDTVTVDHVTINQKYLNVMSAGITTRTVPEFVPSKSCVSEELAGPPPLSLSGEECYFAEGGEPAYIVQLVGIERDSEL